MVISDDLKWDAHLEQKVLPRLRRHKAFLQWICSGTGTAQRHVALLCYRGVVRPCVEYGAALYGWGATVLGDIESDRGGWGAIGTGTVVGLLAGTYLTGGMDASAPTDGFFSAGRTTMLRVTPRSVTYSVAF